MVIFVLRDMKPVACVRCLLVCVASFLIGKKAAMKAGAT